jgi:hypothetical protein
MLATRPSACRRCGRIDPGGAIGREALSAVRRLAPIAHRCITHRAYGDIGDFRQIREFDRPS